MALSLLCGGLGVASAVDGTVHVQDIGSTATSKEVYTTDKVYTKTETDGKLALKADETEVVKNTKDIATNKENIQRLDTDKLSKEVAIATYATNKALTDLENTVNNKMDESVVEAALNDKANTDLSNLTADGENKIKNIMSADMEKKANKDTVTALGERVGGVEGKVTALENTVGNDSRGLVKDVNDLKNQGNTLNTALGNKADQSALDAAKAKITTNETNINALQTKTAKLSPDGTKLTGMNSVETGALTVKGEISNGAGVTTTLADIKDSMKQTDTNKTWIRRLKDKTTEISYADGEGTKISGVTIKNGNIVGDGNSAITQLANVETDKIKTDSINGKSLTGTTVATEKEVKDVADAVKAETDARTEADNKLEGKINKNTQDITALDGKIKTNADNIQINKDAIAATDKRTGGITRNDAANETKIEGNVTVDNLGNVTAKGNVTAEGQLTGKGVDAGAGDITTEGAVKAGSLTVTDASTLKGDVTMNQKLNVTGDTSLNKTDVNGALTAKGDVILGTNTAQTVTVNGIADFNEAVNMDNGLTVDKGLTVTGDTNLENTTVDGNLKVTGTITTDKMVFGDPATNNYTEIDHGKVTSKNQVNNGAGKIISSSSTFNAKENKVGFANSATGDQSFHKQTSDIIMDNVKDRDNSNNRTQTKTETKDIITDKDGNSSTTSQTASENKTYLKDKDGKNTNSTSDTAKGYDKTIKGENGETSTKQDELNITNTAKDGTITNDAKDIVNTATTMKTTVTGKATESYGELETTVNGNETHTVTGNQDIHVTGKQTNTVEGGQENIISGGQTNTITGDQTTTITGNKTETVTENVTEDYKKDLTTTVGGNETHEVKGTKTETVEGKVTENYNGGQETNVTGDQVIKVSGTQTTTATDINRNASSGMIDTIDNDYGTNTETKVAGKTTTDVSIKGTGEEGKYIRGANESRDYLIKGTLKNSETKTVDATSTEITDGKGKTSATIQDVNNLAGSVTNGTETGVSGIHANDNSVSIDSIVTDGNKYSVINQKKGSIQSTVVDGTNSTVILQDTDNVTIASANGTVAIGGKYIVNNASESITNKAKTMDTTVTGKATESYGELETTVNGQATENYKGGLKTDITGEEIHTVTGNQTNKVTGKQTNTVEGGQENIISGGQINNITGDQTTIISGTQTTTATDINRNASSGMIDTIDNAYGTNTETKEAGKTTTDVSIKGTGEKGQYIRGANESRDYLIKGILKNSETKTAEATSTEITDGTNKASTRQDAKNLAGSVTNGTETGVSGIHANNDGSVSIDSAVTDGTNTSVQNQTASQIATGVKDGAGNENASVANATTSVNTIKSGSKANTVISTADGTSFINSEAAAPVGDGTEVKTTIKGNTITTGKVTMDYAEVMKDLGVRGNANITGKTTTGSLEVTGTSTLKGDVTMESNATVKKDLTVEGNTNLKNTKVDGTLDVTQKATFSDSVSIAKDLSVGGDVTASSYKVGDKTYISAAGINANDQKITNVADGSISEGSKDAVNGGQLYTVKNDLEGKVNKVGANAAAMANLHPMEFDPSSKWNIAAAIGNYGSETAAALGAFYRPNDDVMVNLSTAFGTGENMVGGGVSVRLGKGGNKLSREETNALKAQVADLTARMDALLSVLNPNMSKDFPDVPENHWAYEAVSRLAGNDIVQGYPDGEFHGERTMTRYEMAEIIYNALSRGAEAEKELVEEFKPELQAMAASEKATAEKAEG